MIINDHNLSKVIEQKLPVYIAQKLYYVVKQPTGSCDGCVFINDICPQKAVAICTSNGGNILVKDKPKD